jgi:hypothetical protein
MFQGRHGGCRPDTRRGTRRLDSRLHVHDPKRPSGQVAPALGPLSPGRPLPKTASGHSSLLARPFLCVGLPRVEAFGQVAIRASECCRAVLRSGSAEGRRSQGGLAILWSACRWRLPPSVSRCWRADMPSPVFRSVPARGLDCREPTAAAARCNQTNGFHQPFFSQRVNLPFLRLQRARAARCGRGLKPGSRASVWSLP